MSDQPHKRRDMPVDESGRMKPTDPDRLSRQIGFILEVDKLKNTLRQTLLTDRSRRENAAEHSWHIALSVMVLSEYARDRDLDVLRVIRMLLVHDLVEIDAGDTYCYDTLGRKDQQARELRAADRIFSLLPPDQAVDFRRLWEEFEARSTPGSRFAHALDRLQPFLNNYSTKGQKWKEHGIDRIRVADRMKPLGDGAPELWRYVCRLMDDAVDSGYLAG